ncbi:MAG: outer membrane lipoprotein-sorting protein [Reichenbachiella sp.]|uniref:outer membrane lipoprotein-sorting protein n=1 Tax=Reichenbachiella sp. TaxID=2184521 RepID=UPI003266FEE0
MQSFRHTIIRSMALLMVMISLGAYAQDAKEIIRKADQKRRGDVATATMTISIIRPSWSRDMSIKSWSIGTKYSLILVTSPARDKGTVFLKRDNEIWNWIPTIERNIKLPPSMMMQSWMGSDFTNDDLIKESSIVEDYTHSIVGDSLIMGRAVYKIELIPKPDTPVVWGKIYSWIDKQEYIELRSELYDEDGYLVNEVIFLEIKPLGGRLLPSVMEYIPADKEGHKTVIKYHEVNYDAQHDVNFFSLQNMKRIR